MAVLKDKLAGKFIVLDGPDGSGKSTQLERLASALAREGLDVVRTRDPGGTAIGDRIRAILLNHDLSTMDVRCETFLFMASRAQLAGQIIEPAIKAGRTVLCDRFISATCAYQGAAGYDVRRIIELGRYAVGDTWPDLTIVLDVPADEGFRRMGGREGGQGGRDAMESRPLAFHRKVRELFINLPDEYPGLVEVIDGAGPPEEIHARILEVLRRVDL